MRTRFSSTTARRGRSCLLGICLLVLTWPLAATKESKWEDPPFLWVIEGERPSYLFGTIHFGDPRLRIPPAVVDAALASADVLYTEIPFDPASMRAVNRAMIAPEGEGLAERLPTDLYEEARGALRTIQEALDIAAFDGFRVWAFATQLVMLEAQLRNPFSVPLDLLLHQRAEQEGRKTRALETVEEQIGIFADLSAEAEIDLLRETLAQLAEFRAADMDPIEELLATYLSGDLDALAAKLAEWTAGTARGTQSGRDELMTALIDDRDRRMAKRIADFLRNEPEMTHFFAVGAGHFATETGIQHQLREMGFRVRRVGEAE